MSEARHVLEDYRLDRVLNSTARTTVFRAVDPATDRPVAIKLIYPAGPIIQETNRSAFLYAAEVARTGVVSGLPRIIDFGLTHDDNAFLVMDMVDLAVPIDRLGDSSPRRRLGLAQGIAHAVDTLAMSGAAHLNLSPGNVLVTADDGVLLTGYGTAAFLAGAPSGAWPDPEDPWIAPELAVPDALRMVDLPRADAYSLAKVVCEVLSADVRWSAGDAPVVRLESAPVANGREIEAALSAALCPRPEARVTTVSDLRRMLVDADTSASGVGVVEGLDPSRFETRAITLPLDSERPPEVAVVGVDPEAPIAEAPPSEYGGPNSVFGSHGAAPSVPSPADRADGADSTIRWDVIVPVAAVAVVAMLLSVLVLGRSQRDEPTVAAIPEMAIPIAEVPTPAREAEPAINPLLEQAEQLLLDGDVAGARRLLGDFPAQLVESFGVEERELFEGLLGSIENEDIDKALSDLVGGLEHGSVRMLRRGIAGLGNLPADERAAIPDLEPMLARARKGVRLHGELGEAEQAGAHLVVIDRAAEMMRVLPEYSRSYTLREDAAVALQAAAEDAAARRDFEGAIGILTELEKRWPDREGVTGRIAWCEQQKRVDEKLESVLRSARAAGRRGDPETGLKMLDAANPSGPYVARFGAARAQLEDQLTTMDASLPSISLDPSFEAAFKKNETVLVPLTVTDDFRVESVSAWIGTGGGKAYQEVVLEAAADGSCPLEITPEMHGNRTVYFYVTASDPAGHEVYLGSPDAPYEIERKKWFNKVIP